MNRFLEWAPIALLFFFVLTFWLLVASAIPRLTGYNCEGSTGPLYANEEDHFPKCEFIVPTDIIRESFKDYKDTD